MNRQLACILACAPLMNSCMSDPPQASTSDEVTTTLQSLADNIRKLPSAEKPSLAARTADAESAPRPAARTILPNPEDSGSWIPAIEFHDRADHSVWEMVRVDPMRVDPTRPERAILVSDDLSNGIDGLFQRTEIETFANGKFVFGSDRFEITRRSGFRYLFQRGCSRDTTTEEWVQLPETLSVPSLGITVVVPADSADSLLTKGVPVMRSGVRIGTLVLRNWTDLRWFDLAGREYVGNSGDPRPFGPDSVGLHVSSMVRDTVDGEPGWRLKGWFHLPDSFDLAIDSVYPIVQPTAWWSGSYLRYEYPFKRSAVLPGNRFDHFLALAEIQAGYPSTPPEFGEEHLYFAASPFVRSNPANKTRLGPNMRLYSDSLRFR